MDDPVASVSLIVEAFSWIGLALGIVLLVIGLLRGAFFRGWRRTDGVVVVDESGRRAYRWLGDDAVLYEAPADDDDTQVLDPGDGITVYVSPRDPSVGRIDDPRHEGRALRISGSILLGLGVISSVVSLVLSA
ncbi:hypothetical protein GCM10010988_36170 [Cnuibacter physcomitrellae]|uniref:Uncharacterized protein n=1 Tax=Cnuibacter physcomitrellae TaxID=1619308 RepID=A0A1X9LI02_9MICO|nr:DUF3592 domain-containing protein [Cnuibacter physcomitrellae]ARJ04793.1 hypothetical protein B5808_05845 [Cnuibacter physcomitrellae]GGI41865.1 hypothetical protein GCM10010988_36170 [Cnuibacter physcomitrellae]